MFAGMGRPSSQVRGEDPGAARASLLWRYLVALPNGGRLKLDLRKMLFSGAGNQWLKSTLILMGSRHSSQWAIHNK